MVINVHTRWAHVKPSQVAWGPHSHWGQETWAETPGCLQLVALPTHSIFFIVEGRQTAAAESGKGRCDGVCEGKKLKESPLQEHRLLTEK